MNRFNRMVRSLTGQIAAGILGVASLASSADAAEITLEVYARNRWAVIVPGSNLGGRVVWDSGRGRYITDRADRGEWLFITKSPSTSAERGCPWAYWSDLHSRAINQSRALSSGWMTLFDYTQTPTSPHWDNNHVRICTVSGLYERRVPVGSR